MAQQFPTSAQIIYDTLVADTELMNVLGNYTFRAGQTTDAISIVTAGADLPALRNVTGVECVIHDTGDFSQLDYISQDDSIERITWRVFFICWEPATGADLQQAVRLAAAKFMGSSTIETISTPDGLGSLTQTKLLVMSNMPIR